MYLVFLSIENCLNNLLSYAIKKVNIIKLVYKGHTNLSIILTKH